MNYLNISKKTERSIHLITFEPKFQNLEINSDFERDNSMFEQFTMDISR